jgi:hypothetical protein
MTGRAITFAITQRKDFPKSLIIKRVHGEGIERRTTARLEDSKISPEPAASAVLSGV